MASQLTFFRDLQSDRLIKIVLGPANEPRPSLYVQQKVLEEASEWFSKALRDDRFIEGQTASLSFPDDDPQAWKVLIFWILHRTIPDELKGDTSAVAMKCAILWVLGDKCCSRLSG